MNITFQHIGLTFEAKVYLDEDDQLIFDDLSCRGHDAHFLLESSIEYDLVMAALPVVERLEAQALEDLYTARFEREWEYSA